MESVYIYIQYHRYVMYVCIFCKLSMCIYSSTHKYNNDMQPLERSMCCLHELDLCLAATWCPNCRIISGHFRNHPSVFTKIFGHHQLWARSKFGMWQFLVVKNHVGHIQPHNFWVLLLHQHWYHWYMTNLTIVYHCWWFCILIVGEDPIFSPTDALVEDLRVRLEAGERS